MLNGLEVGGNRHSFDQSRPGQSLGFDISPHFASDGYPTSPTPGCNVVQDTKSVDPTDHRSYRPASITRERARTQQRGCTAMLSDELESYLDHISQYHCAETVASHKTTLTRLVTEIQNRSITADELNLQWIVEYLTKASENYSKSTLRGEISTIANFFAYLRKENPELISKRIKARLNREGITRDKRNVPSEDLQTTVETYLESVRTRAYGTRVHAATEIIVATGCRLGSLRALNVGDVDLDAGEIELSIPKKHAVSRTDLVTTRTETLPEETVRALQTYIAHERVSTSTTDGSEPLFTTRQGRLSAATLRRSMQAIMDAVCSSPLNDDPTRRVVEDDTIGEYPRLSPRDIRRYYIAQLIQE